MDKAIVTVLLIISGVVAALAIFNGVMPAIDRSQSAIVDATNKATDRIGSRISIIEAGASGSQVKVWVKNVGTTVIDSISQSDVFLTSSTDVEIIPYGGASTPRWEYTLVGEQTAWEQAGTVAIVIYLSDAPGSGTYLFRMVLPNGVCDETYFSVG
jgi:archaeal flagellar protein FlaG